MENEVDRVVDNILDDRGTNELEGRSILKRLRDRGFNESDEKLALALGRPLETIHGWIDGSAPIDDDVIMKARGIAEKRRVQIE